MKKELEQIKDILVAANKEALFKVIDEVAVPALKEAVARTATPLVDAAVATLAPVLVAELKKIITHL